MSISFWLKKTNPEVKQYDYIIVGAGIAGLSTAYWLEKKDPAAKIAVVEKHSLGFGASGRNAGFVTCGSAEHFNKLNKQFGLNKAAVIWKFSEQNRKLVISEIVQNNPHEVDFIQTGSCTVAATNEDWDRYQNLHQTMKEAGIDVELIDESYLSQHYGVKGFRGAIQYLHDGIIHPIKLLNKIKSKLTNTSFFFGEEIHQLTEGHQTITIETQNIKLKAQKVFLCLNGYVDQIIPELKNVIKPQRGQVIVTEPLPAFVKGPCYLTKHLCYFRQLPTGELLVGGFRNHDLDAENTAFDNLNEKIQNALTDFTTQYFQGTKNVKINHRWSGVMGFSPDEQMIVGEWPKTKNLFLMAGCSGHGMGLSFNVARVLVESSFGMAPPEHLNINRFKY